MNTSIWLWPAFAIGVALVTVVLRRRSANRQTRNAATKIIREPAATWGARFVVPPGTICCDAAKALAGTSFRHGQTPTLPLPECNVGNCPCSFEPHLELRGNRDRRTEQDRRDAIRFDTENGDRRDGEDRRRGNNSWRGP